MGEPADWVDIYSRSARACGTSSTAFPHSWGSHSVLRGARLELRSAGTSSSAHHESQALHGLWRQLQVMFLSNIQPMISVFRSKICSSACGFPYNIGIGSMPGSSCIPEQDLGQNICFDCRHITLKHDRCVFQTADFLDSSIIGLDNL